jgi:PHD/YefM family antitoxin component YafN of YafNO toxin-antitoxin module
MFDVNPYGMTSDSIVNITEAQAKLNKLVDQDSFAISRHGKIVGVYLSRDRIEALIETMELLSNPEFATALKDYEAGRTKFYDSEELDKAMSR